MAPANPLTVTYLVEGTQLFGGVKVVFRQADLMAARGHSVTVLSKGPEPTWYRPRAEFRQVGAFEPTEIPPSDVVVATDWPTLAPAVASGRGAPAHLFQGDEASYTHNITDHPAIRRAYAHPIPALVVSPHLGEVLERQYGRPWRHVAQPLEPFFRPPRFSLLTHRGPSRPARVLVVGPFECDWKGVATALAAVDQVRTRGLDCRLVRLSQLPLLPEEAELARADEFHTHIRPEEAARLISGCDLLLAPSWEQEGFGLPVLEAMACGTPVVASDISCFRHFAHDAALLVPAGQPAAFAEAAHRVLTNPREWRRLRRLGREVAGRFTEARSGSEAERALGWVASGEWRRQLRSLPEHSAQHH